MYLYINKCLYIYIYIFSYIYLTACVAKLTKASDTQAVRRGFEYHPNHSNISYNTI